MTLEESLNNIKQFINKTYAFYLKNSNTIDDNNNNNNKITVAILEKNTIWCYDH